MTKSLSRTVKPVNNDTKGATEGVRINGVSVLRDGPLETLWGGGGGWRIFELQECFSLSNSFYEFFLDRSMNIFYG